VTNLTIGITAPAIGRPTRLRADGIRVKDLMQLGRTLAEGDDRARRLIDALEHLGQISHDPAEGELDWALGEVATLANLDAAEMDLTPADVEQLAGQAEEALDVLARASRPVAPRREARAA
jgi:hypothetical protein